MLLHSLGCSTLALIHTLYCWVLNKASSSTIFESLVWLDLGLNPGLLDPWQTLYWLDQWPEHWQYQVRVSIAQEHIYQKIISSIHATLWPHSFILQVYGHIQPSKLFGGNCGIMGNAIRNGCINQSRISYITNTLGKGMNPNILPPSIGK